MTVKCVCGEEFVEKDKAESHLKSCGLYNERKTLVDSYDNIVTATEENFSKKLIEIKDDYGAAKIVLKSIAKAMKTIGKTIEDRAAAIQTTHPELYQKAIDALLLGTLALKQFLKDYGNPPVKVLQDLLNLGRLTQKKFNKLTVVKEIKTIKINKKAVKRYVEKVSLLGMVGASVLLFFKSIVFAILGTVPSPWIMPAAGFGGSFFILNALKKNKLGKELLNGKDKNE